MRLTYRSRWSGITRRFNCWSCGQEIVIRFLKSGEEAKCRNCSRINVVPEGNTSGLVPESALEQQPSQTTTKAREAKLLEQVATILESSDGQKVTALEAWAVFLLTLLTFVVVRLKAHFLLKQNFDVDIVGLTVIVVSVLIHELGHFVAMEQLGYEDVRIFFLPLFGAASSGTNPPRDSLKRSVVLIAGPVPGVLIGAACSVYSRYTGDTTGASIAETFLVINALNLLPVPPMDGGRLLDELIFAKSPVGVIFARIVSGIGLLTISVTCNAPLLALLSILPFLFIKSSYRKAKATRLIHSKFPRGAVSEAAVPSTCLEYAVPLIAPYYAADNYRPVAIASDIRNAWLVAQGRPASARAKSTLVVCQVLAIAVAIWFLTRAQSPTGAAENGSTATGTEASRQRTLSDEGQFAEGDVRPVILAPEQYLVKLRYPFPTQEDLNGVFVEFEGDGRKQVLLVTTILGLLSEEECFQIMRPGMPKAKLIEGGWYLLLRHNCAVIRKEDADRLPPFGRARYDRNIVALKVATENPRFGDTLYCAGEWTESPRQTLVGVVRPESFYAYGEEAEQVVRFLEGSRSANQGLPILNSRNELVGLHDITVYQTFPMNLLGPRLGLPAKDRLMVRVDRKMLSEAVRALNERAVYNGRLPIETDNSSSLDKGSESSPTRLR